MVVKVVGIYLAAGKGKRMGQNKLALPWMGYPLGFFGLRAALQSELEKVIVVFNKDINNEWASPWVRHKKVHTLISPDSNEGQAASIRYAIKEAYRLEVEGVIILLADQPHVQTEVLDGLVNRFESAVRESEAVHYIGYKVKQMIRPPILFTKSAFSGLLTLQGDMGARNLLKQNHWKGITLDWPSALPFIDIDTWEDYQNLMTHE